MSLVLMGAEGQMRAASSCKYAWRVNINLQGYISWEDRRGFNCQLVSARRVRNRLVCGINYEESVAIE